VTSCTPGCCLPDNGGWPATFAAFCKRPARLRYTSAQPAHVTLNHLNTKQRTIMRKLRRIKNMESTYRIFFNKLVNSMLEELAAEVAERGDDK